MKHWSFFRCFIFAHFYFILSYFLGANKMEHLLTDGEEQQGSIKFLKRYLRFNRLLKSFQLYTVKFKKRPTKHWCLIQHGLQSFNNALQFPSVILIVFSPVWTVPSWTTGDQSTPLLLLSEILILGRADSVDLGNWDVTCSGLIDSLKNYIICYFRSYFLT